MIRRIFKFLFVLLFAGCEDNSVEPLVCDEGLTDVDGICTLVCGEGLTDVDGECVFVCEDGVTECYYQGDLDVLQDFIDVNDSLSGEPLEIGSQLWVDGRLEVLFLMSNQLTSIPESIGNLSSLRILFVSHNQLTTFPESFCNLSMDWGLGNEWSPYSLLIYNNQLCSSIPTCIVDYLGEQDCDD